MSVYVVLENWHVTSVMVADAMNIIATDAVMLMKIATIILDVMNIPHT